MGRRREQSGEQVRTSGVHHPRVVRRLLASTLRHGERQGRGSRRPQSLVARVNEIACHHGTRRRRTLARSGAAWGARAMGRCDVAPPPAVPHPSAAPRPIDRRGWRGARHHTGFHRARAAPSGSWRERGVRSVVATERGWSARPCGTPYAHTCAESPRSGASNACASRMPCPTPLPRCRRRGLPQAGVASRDSQRRCRRDGRAYSPREGLHAARTRTALEPSVAASYAALRRRCDQRLSAWRRTTRAALKRAGRAPAPIDATRRSSATVLRRDHPQRHRDAFGCAGRAQTRTLRWNREQDLQKNL